MQLQLNRIFPLSALLISDGVQKKYNFHLLLHSDAFLQVVMSSLWTHRVGKIEKFNLSIVMHVVNKWILPVDVVFVHFKFNNKRIKSS